MRKSGRFQRKPIYSNRRGLLSKTRFSRTKAHCRLVLLVGALLLLLGVLSLIRSVHHGGVHSKNSQDKEPIEEKDQSREYSDLILWTKTQKADTGAEIGLKFHEAEAGTDVGDKTQMAEAGEESFGEEDSFRGLGDDDDDENEDENENESDHRDANSFQMSVQQNKPEADEQGARDRRATENAAADEEENQAEEEEEEGLCDRTKYPPESELQSDKITILVNGFSESRLPLLEKNLQAYSSLALVHSIYILWGNTSTPDDCLDRWNFSSYGAPTYLVRQDSPSLNARFLPRRYIKTKVVAVCDDDITVDLQSLGFALDVWREDEGRIVGFFPRTHVYDHESQTWLYTRHYKSYSIMLTKFMILATEYLYKYTCEMPLGVKEYVDGGMNCEDIAMNFLASSLTGKGPLLVEGNARDWGDPRNSAVEHHFEDAALSRKSSHLKDRGGCITDFERLWKGMKLQYSHSKASADLENEIQCEKFGYLIDCDKSVGSQRDAARLAEQSIPSSQRYAYATLLPSHEHINTSILLAQSLRSSGTLHDLILLLDPNSRAVPETHIVHEHFDEVVRLNRSRGDPRNRHCKLGAWLLLGYAKVVFLDVDSLVLANLDHLFQLPELTAAPHLFRPGQFSTGLLVLKPSKQTHVRLQRMLEVTRGRHCSGDCLLNSAFDDWFYMPAENRLPARYNFPAVLSKELKELRELKELKSPSWFDVGNADKYLGQIMVVHFGNSGLKQQGKNFTLDSHDNPWLGARWKLFQFLQQNGLSPLENVEFRSWAPTEFNHSSHPIQDSNWPLASEVSLPLEGFSALSPHRKVRAREAFVTVLCGNERPQFSVAGWAESFHFHHPVHSRPKTLLVVSSVLHPDQYREHMAYFDEVRIVEPFAVNGKALPDSFTLLHLWNQTDFDRLVYVAASSLFVENCNSLLLDYLPFAAAPSSFPMDTFSTQVMSLQPDHRTYDLFRKRLLSSYEFSSQPVERFLSKHYKRWYQTSSRHRISPSYSVSVALESRFQGSPALPRKVLNFGLDWLPEEEGNVTRVWRKTVCGLRPGKNPNLLLSLCGTM